MNKERYNQIIDEAYENYAKFVLCTENQNNKHEIVKIPESKEIFIKTVKSNDEIVKNMGKKYCEKFSERWRLKIEEKELCGLERWSLCKNEIDVDDADLYSKLDRLNIPTKLITVTYKDEKNRSI